MTEAKRVLAEALDRRPELTISYVLSVGINPYPQYKEIFLDGLRKAGMAEG